MAMKTRTEFGIVHLIPGVDRALPGMEARFGGIMPSILAALADRRVKAPPGAGAPFAHTWDDTLRIFPAPVPAGVDPAAFKAELQAQPGAVFRIVSDDGKATIWRELSPGHRSVSPESACELWAPLLLAYAMLLECPERQVGRELAEDVAALPKALRSIFVTCGDPTHQTLARLAAEVPEEERGGMSPIVATRQLSCLAVRQAAMQWHRRARHDREAAYAATYAVVEEFPTPTRTLQ